jgi:hypothetical protein
MYVTTLAKKTESFDKVSLTARCIHWVRTTHEYFCCAGPYDCTIRKFVLTYFGRTIFFLDGLSQAQPHVAFA